MKRLFPWKQKYATPLHKISYLLEEIAKVPNERKRKWAAIKLLCMVAVPYFLNGVRRSLSQLMSDPNYVVSIGIIQVMKHIRMWNYFQDRLQLSPLTRLRILNASYGIEGGLIVKRDTA